MGSKIKNRGRTFSSCPCLKCLKWSPSWTLALIIDWKYHPKTHHDYIVDFVIKPSNFVITKRQTVFLNIIAIASLCSEFSDGVRSEEIYLKIRILVIIVRTPGSKT